MDISKLNIDSFPINFNWYNDQFPPLDALTYWHFLKGAKKVIEVGCGYSTQLAWQSGAEVTAIDPQPRVFSVDIPYILKPVQEVELAVFEQLNQGDILFIDSSHIYAEGTDVYFLINQVLPKLKEGVLIHFHDFFGEYGYPTEWQQNPEMKLWNENEYLMPLLVDYQTLCFNYDSSKTKNEQLKAAYPFVPTDIKNNLGAVRGASLWLKK
jgi:hypothetical protein